MRLRRFALLFFILVGGLSLEAAHKVRHDLDLDFGPFGWRILGGGPFDGPSFEFEETLTEPIPAGGAIEVANTFGSVRIFRGTGKDALVRLKKVVFKENEAHAREFANRIKVDMSSSDGTLRLGTNRAGVGSSGSERNVGFETNFDIEVPEGTRVTVLNKHGDVNVADVAQATVVNGFGSVAVSRIAGPADIRCDHGDVRAASLKDTLKVVVKFGDVDVSDAGKAVNLEIENGTGTVARAGSLDGRLKFGDLSAEAVAGDARFHGEQAKVDFKDVTGNVVVETAFRDVSLTRIGGEATVKSSHGNVSASQVQGALFVEAGYGDVDATDIGGPVEISVEHGDVQAQRVPRGAKIHAPGGDVRLARFGGEIDVTSERGSLELDPSTSIVDAIKAQTRYGTIELTVPDGSRFDLDAQTETGEVRVGELRGYAPVAGASSSEGDSRRHSAGRVGGGGKIVVLRASHGDVTLQAPARISSKEDE